MGPDSEDGLVEVKAEAGGRVGDLLEKSEGTVNS